jgi:phage gp36-like protein
MSYITNSDIERRVGANAYVQLTDDDGDASANEDVVDEVRLAAEGDVNAHLSRRYQVPIDLVTVPELAGLLSSITLDIAELRLRERRPPVPIEAQRRAERARLWLQGVAGGALDLPSLAPLPGTTLRGPVAGTSGEERVLSRDELSGH